jgi:hypothetical protein
VSWPADQSNEQLISHAARCIIDKERLELDLGACCDGLVDAIDELAERDVPNPRGRVIAKAFELWLADPTAQDWQRSQYELRRTADRLMREMQKQQKKRKREGGDSQ